jgi:hypothetical protein
VAKKQNSLYNLAMSTSELPFAARLTKAPQRKFRETIVFLHHFGGNRSSSKRHQELVGKLGFDSISFNLSYNALPNWKSPLVALRNLMKSAQEKNLVTIWSEELNALLNEIEGPKILYTFSSPSTAALQTLAEEQRQDVKGWICDGGPFLDLYNCLLRYYREETMLPRWLHPVGAAMGYHLFGGYTFSRRTQEWLANFPKDLPILSIRSGQDRLVPVGAILDFFARGNAKLPLEVFLLPSADHLEGLKKFPTVYEARVAEFLYANSFALEEPGAGLGV